MTPSFELFKKGAVWWARTTLPSGTVMELSLDTKNEEAAKDIAKSRVLDKWRASKAGLAAGKHLRARKAAVAEGLRAADSPPAPDPPPPPPEPEAPPAPPAVPISEERAAAIAGKLRALGDGQPLGDEDDGDDDQADKIYAPGEREKEKKAEEEKDEVDDETGELLADLIATAIVAGTVKGVTIRLAKRKPPERPAEPHEKMLEWYHFGARENLRKLIGKAGTLGPTAKLFIGGTGVVVSMVWGAEIIDEASRPRETATPRPAAQTAHPAEAAASSGSNGTTPAPAPASSAAAPAPTPESGVIALGKFH